MFCYKEDKKIDLYVQINIVTQIHNMGLPIDDPFWDKHRPGDQWNCKCWLEQTDAPRTALEDMPDSADIPEPKAGLRGNTAKAKEIFSQDKDIEEVWLREENRIYLFFKRNGN